MSSVITSPERRAVTPERADVEWLRCPGERSALLLCVVSNAIVLGLAIAILLATPSWLEDHPILARRVDMVRGIVAAAVLAFPAAALLRHVAFHAAQAGGVRVGPHQFPELHQQFLAAARKLGVYPVPELYVSREVDGRVAEAHTLWGGRAVVVVNAEFMDERWVAGLDWLTFAVVGALGAVRLGHTRWWVELLTVYARRIPGLRTPILIKWTYSRDRCAAYIVPDGIRGLVVEAVGNHALPTVDIPSFLDQTDRPTGLWDLLASVARTRPSLVMRARALYDGGFFDRAKDQHRDRFAPPDVS